MTPSGTPKKNKKLSERTWTHWQWYRDFFGIHILRYLVTWFAIVPIAANLLMKLPKEIVFGRNYIINLELPFKWECLWLSSFCFVIAFVLYKIFCPKFIVKYFSLKQYSEYHHSPRWLTREAEDLVKHKSILDKFVTRMKTKSYITEESQTMDDSDLPLNKVEGNQTVLFFNHAGKTYRFGMPVLNATEDAEDETKTKIAVREIFWEIFGRFSSSWPCVRIIILVLLTLALLLFLFAVGQNISTGLSYLVE